MAGDQPVARRSAGKWRALVGERSPASAEMTVSLGMDRRLEAGHPPDLCAKGWRERPG